MSWMLQCSDIEYANFGRVYHAGSVVEHGRARLEMVCASDGPERFFSKGVVLREPTVLHVYARAYLSNATPSMLQRSTLRRPMSHRMLRNAFDTDAGKTAERLGANGM